MNYATSKAFTGKIAMALGISIMLTALVYDTRETFLLHRSNTLIQQDDRTILLSQSLLNDLIGKMAKQQYLKDMTDNKVKLLLYHRSPDQPKTTRKTLHSDVGITRGYTVLETNTVINNQQCFYQNKPYFIGAIIQTEQGWMQCVSALQNNAGEGNSYLNAVWAFRNTLL